MRFSNRISLLVSCHHISFFSSVARHFRFCHTNNRHTISIDYNNTYNIGHTRLLLHRGSCHKKMCFSKFHTDRRFGSCRINAALLLTVGLVLITSIGVRCFAIGERRDIFKPRSFLFNNEPPPTVQQGRQERIGSSQYTYTALSASPVDWVSEDKNERAGNSSGEHSSRSDDDATKADQSKAVEQANSPGIWPCFDEMDRTLIKISLPIIANYAINPLIGAVDLFWVNRMGNALAVAGQAAANQVFSSAFWLISFLPSGKIKCVPSSSLFLSSLRRLKIDNVFFSLDSTVTATLVSKSHASGNKDATQDAVCQALVVGFIIALIGSALMLWIPDKALSTVLTGTAFITVNDCICFP